MKVSVLGTPIREVGIGTTVVTEYTGPNNSWKSRPPNPPILLRVWLISAKLPDRLRLDPNLSFFGRWLFKS